MNRAQLPNRRLQFGTTLIALSANAETKIFIDAGFDRAGHVREIFVDGLREGSDLQALVTHAAILASMLLQHGYTPQDLLDHIGGPALVDPACAGAGHSIVSRALAVAIGLQVEAGTWIAAAHVAIAEATVRR
ncbi:MAG: hypothetical protein QOJ54_1022 [Aliidongia sp.]|nr:hypothetical protein [Aliidongia sp.]